MRYEGKCVTDLKIAYIGGGSRGWAWGLMSDLASCEDMCGQVLLYDIDFDAAKNNEVIGNKFNEAKGAKSTWNYKAVRTIEEALLGADFVVISILPGTFEEMESDVHTPEKYGIYQSVGDTIGPGGIIRAMRTIPMYEYFGEKIKENCPNAWVISYTNPMTLCIKALYRVFPEIKAFGCCHEVFGTQSFLARVAEESFGVEHIERDEIKVNPVAVNHFTWLTSVTYRHKDRIPYYREFCQRHPNGYPTEAGETEETWKDSVFGNRNKVKMDLFNRFGVIAAAGDRHLAEFCEGKWFLENPDRVSEMCFHLTPVSWRKKDLSERLARSARLISGEEEVVINKTGEEGVNQMRALLGLKDLVTNVNIPNRGQIPNLPRGAVVETNAVFRSNSLEPVFAGAIPTSIYPMVSRICGEQELISEGIAKRDLRKIQAAFSNDPLVTCSLRDSEKLFKEMCDNTRSYLTMY